MTNPEAPTTQRCSFEERLKDAREAAVRRGEVYFLVEDTPFDGGKLEWLPFSVLQKGDTPLGWKAFEDKAYAEMLIKFMNGAFKEGSEFTVKVASERIGISSSDEWREVLEKKSV